MATSRKGKKASRNLMIKDLTNTFNNRLQKVAIQDRPQLYKAIKDMIAEFEGEQRKLCEIALSKCDCAYECEMILGLEKALSKINNK